MQNLLNKKDLSYVNIAKRMYNSSSGIKEYKRHYPPANKEWKDSAYSYNKNYLKSLPFNNNVTDSLITSHFHISNLKEAAGSKRMRAVMVKKSSNKIFVSKPHIKHNNDKIVVNLYTFNRQKENLIRKLYFSRTRYNINKKLFSNIIKKRNKKLFSNIIKKKNYNLKNKLNRKYQNSKDLPFYGIKYKKELGYLKNMTLYKKFAYLNNIFIFMFFRKLLYLFNINLFMPVFGSLVKNIEKTDLKFPKNINKLVLKNWVKRLNKLNKDILIRKILIKEILVNKPSKVMWLDKNINQLNFSNKDFINEKLLKKIIFKYRYDYSDIILVNKLILHYVVSRFITTGIISEFDLIDMYIKFKTKYYNKFMFKFFGKKDTMLHYLKGLELNIFKFGKLLSNLKIFISRIYNKKTELNITNLKYPFLNSDIFTKVTIVKAIKKINFLRVLKSSINLPKIPREIFHLRKDSIKLNNDFYNSYNKLSLNNLLLAKNYSKDKLENVFSNIYSNHLINKKPTGFESKVYLNKVLTVLSTIKFKWISGVWLQGAGRTTRRFTAARSVLNIRNKGSLANKQYVVEKNNVLKSISTIMLRNTVKSNSQYTFMKSKRRIGSFGIKSWISGY